MIAVFVELNIHNWSNLWLVSSEYNFFPETDSINTDT